jgi:hypothetical protein
VEDDDDSPRPAARLDRLIDPLRLETLGAAGVYASRDREELAVLLGGLQIGLLGIDEMQTLLDLSLAGGTESALASAFETARRVLLPMSLPPTPGGPEGGGFPPLPPGGAGRWPIPLPGFGWPLPGGGLPPRPEPPGIPAEPPRGAIVTDFSERCLTTRIVPELHRRGIGFRSFVTGSSGHYRIDSVEPMNACPGTEITIRGSNFDGTTAVHFVDDAGRTLAVPPSRVSSSQVTVDLPEGARTGPVSLYIPMTVRLCSITTTMARPGSPGEIRVGRPSILRFGVRYGLECVARGDGAALVWSVLPDDAEVTITEWFGTAERELEGAAPATGSLDLDTTGAAGTYTYRIDVRNPDGSCGDASRTVPLEVKPRGRTRFVIVGVERTQGIQVFSLSDPPPEPNNSIGLIAHMDTVLRVFVRTTFPATGAAARVTGVLTWDGNTYMPVNAPGPFIDAPRAPDRKNTDDSLNFLIPAADAVGSGEAVIDVFTTGSCSDARETWRETLTWVERPALPVTIRRIAESGSPPAVLSTADALDLVTRAFSRIPSPRTDIRLHPGVHQIREGTTEDNYCTDGGFYQLALSIAYEHNDNEGYPPAPHSSSWLGIFTRTDCNVSGMMAWPSTSTCISEPLLETVAHELMHTVGLGHTKTSAGEDCENIGQPVACHRLDHLADGALAHVPFDIANNRTVVGANDLQSYRPSPRWLSTTLWVLGRTLMDTRY